MGFLRRHKILSAALLIFVAIVTLVSAVAVRFIASFSSVPLVISKQTTYITGPLRSDGTPDYAAALNQRLSKGVTPENNAAVLFWKATEPNAIKPEIRERYFEMLGVPQPPEKGDYLLESDEWIKRRKGADAEAEEKRIANLYLACARPWSKQELPDLAEWLAAGEKPLALIVEGTKRPRCYFPLVIGSDNDDSLLAVSLAGTQQCRDFARSLVLRAMLRIKEGKVDEAWDDLLACHRLARLVGQGPFIVDALVAMTIDNMANRGDQALLQHAKLTAPQIAKMRQDIARLPLLPKIVDTFNRGERLTMLDAVLSVSRQTVTGRGAPAGMPEVPVASGVDWNIILRISNSWYDRLVAAASKPTRADRQKASVEINRDINAQIAAAESWTTLPSLIVNRREAVSQRLGLIFMSLLMPATGVTTTAEDRTAMESELTRLAFALAEYRAEHGLYPAKLADLVPKYVKKVPKDVFNNNADLHYTLQGNGYLLYSIGINEKDDGGKGADDVKNNEGWDDLTVRMSAAKP